MINTKDSKNYLLERLKSIQAHLISEYNGSNPASSSKGRQREEFLNNFLKEIIPSTFRFGNGEIIDSDNEVTGQLDIVVENSLVPSLTSIGSTPRVYLAEGVGAVIEVKSNIQKEWNDVLETARKVKKLSRKNFGGRIFLGDESFLNTIPVFAVGYKGWTQKKTLEKKIIGSNVDGILIIDPGIFVTNNLFKLDRDYNNAQSLWGFIVCLHQSLESIKIIQTNLENFLSNQEK